MPERKVTRHGLEAFLAGLPPVPGNSTLRVGVVPGLVQFNLRGDPSNRDFTAAAARALGQDLPLRPNRFSEGDHRAFWMGPDEWLIVSASQPGRGLRAALEGLESVPGTAVNDVSAGQVCLSLAGEPAREVLAKGCTLDFHPDVFGVGNCAQSGLARATMLVAQVTGEPEFELYVRRSYADYLARWLHHSGREFGIKFYVTQDPRSRE
ncbi:MAG: sarcosine oxidase subunit gamma family protein [Lysobacterales bacterium]|jgi:sarcosine oxidase subunit gamma